MVIDTSALIAILLNEPDALSLSEIIDADQEPVMSAASFLEAGMIMQSRRGDRGVAELEALLYEAAIKIISFDRDQSETAIRAFRKYGKGQHPAGLNFGDCMAYALAKELDEPLLFKGADFAKTDIKPAFAA